MGSGSSRHSPNDPEVNALVAQEADSRGILLACAVTRVVRVVPLPRPLSRAGGMTVSVVGDRTPTSLRQTS